MSPKLMLTFCFAIIACIHAVDFFQDHFDFTSIEAALAYQKVFLKPGDPILIGNIHADAKLIVVQLNIHASLPRREPLASQYEYTTITVELDVCSCMAPKITILPVTPLEIPCEDADLCGAAHWCTRFYRSFERSVALFFFVYVVFVITLKEQIYVAFIHFFAQLTPYVSSMSIKEKRSIGMESTVNPSRWLMWRATG